MNGPHKINIKFSVFCLITLVDDLPWRQRSKESATWVFAISAVLQCRVPTVYSEIMLCLMHFLRISVNRTKNYALIMILQGVGISHCEWKRWWLISKTRKPANTKGRVIVYTLCALFACVNKNRYKIYFSPENSGKNHEILFTTLKLKLEIVIICQSIIFIFQNRNKFVLFPENLSVSFI